jgi:hypothetical protein
MLSPLGLSASLQKKSRENTVATEIRENSHQRPTNISTARGGEPSLAANPSKEDTRPDILVNNPSEGVCTSLLNSLSFFSFQENLNYFLCLYIGYNLFHC